MRFLVAFLVIFSASAASAASLRVCWDATSVTPDVAQIQLVDTRPAAPAVIIPDLVPGAVATGTKACSTQPLPTVQRGVDIPVALRATNSLGEVGGLSNIVTFRVSTSPPALTGFTITITVP